MQNKNPNIEEQYEEYETVCQECDGDGYIEILDTCNPI